MIAAIVLTIIALVIMEVFSYDWMSVASAKKKEPKEKKPSVINRRIVRYILFIICIALLAGLNK
jgi:hypothetical protein